MLLRKGLLALAAGFALAGPAAGPAAERRAGPGAAQVVVTGLWELLLERLTFPLGTATPRQGDRVVWW